MTDADDCDDATFSECHSFHMCVSYAQANPLRCLGLEAGLETFILSVSESLVSLSMPCALATQSSCSELEDDDSGGGESFPGCSS